MSTKISISNKFTASGDIDMRKSSSLSYTMSFLSYISENLTITSSESSIHPFTFQGLVWVKNNSPTEFIDLSTGTGATFDAHRFARIPPGGTCQYWGTSNVVNVKLYDTGDYGLTGKIDVAIFEE